MAVNRSFGTGSNTTKTIAGVSLAAVLLSTAGCASKASGLKVTSAAAAAGKVGDQGTTCPLTFDKASVLKTAGISGTLTPSSDPSKIASAQDDTKASPGSPMALHGGGAVVTCGFEITANGSTTDVTVELLTVNSGLAWQVLIPSLLQKSKLSETQLQPMLAAGFSTGTVRLTPGAGTVAVDRPKVSGSGDAALMVAVGGPGAASIAGAPLEKFTTALAAAIKV